MAKGAALFIGWGEVPAGQRKKALKVFGEATAFWTRMQQKGEIEGFEHVFLEAHGGDLSGFNLVRGDREKLNRIRMNPEFETIMARSSLIVENLGIIDAFVGEELQRRLGEVAKNVEELD
jgi:hypothetical protein